jgi:predicted Zn-dependent protease
VIGRIVLGVVAAAAIVWLGVMERDQRLQLRGTAIVGHGKIAEARRDLMRAQTWNPDPQPKLLAALVRFGSGQGAAATQEIGDVVRDEPENIAAWAYLIRVSHGRDAQAEFRARAAIRRLDPLAARGGGAAGP